MGILSARLVIQEAHKFSVLLFYFPFCLFYEVCVLLVYCKGEGNKRTADNGSRQLSLFFFYAYHFGVQAGKAASPIVGSYGPPFIPLPMALFSPVKVPFQQARGKHFIVCVCLLKRSALK